AARRGDRHGAEGRHRLGGADAGPADRRPLRDRARQAGETRAGEASQGLSAAMGRALFYHLTRSAPEALAPRLIARAQDSGFRVEVRGADTGVLERLDELLWLQEGFNAHGRAGGPHDARQPVLLRALARDAGE